MVKDNKTDSKKSIGRDVTKLVSGTVIAQLIGICLSPIITRLFPPDIYGSATLLISIVGFLTIICCFCYERALIIPKKDEDAGSLFVSCLLLLGVICILVSVVWIFFGELIFTLLNAQQLLPYSWLIPVLLFIDGLYLILRYWNTRKGRFGIQAITQSLQALIGSGCKVGLGFGGIVSVGSFIIGTIIGNITGMILIAIQIFRKDLADIRAGCSWENMKKQLVLYKKFPMITTWSSFVNGFAWQSPVYLLSFFFSTAVTGLYSLGFSMIQLPMSLIGASLGQVYYQRGAIANHDGKLASLLEDIEYLLLVLSVIPICYLLVMGGDIFSFFFGQGWTEAGVYCQILSIWAFVWFLTSTTGANTFMILGKQEKLISFHVLNCVTRISSMVIGGMFQSIYLALILLTLSGVLSYGFLLLRICKFSGASLWKILSSASRHLLLAVMYLAFFIVCKMFLATVPVFVLLVITGLPIIGYYLWLVKRDSRLREYLPI